MKEQKVNDNGIPVIKTETKTSKILPLNTYLEYNAVENKFTLNSNLDIVGDVNIEGGLKENDLALGDGITFQFNTNANYTLSAVSNYAGYVRLVEKAMIFVCSFNITKDTLGIGSSAIDVGEFTNIPNSLFDRLVGGTFLDEQNTRAYVDGTFTSVIANTALVKGQNNNVSVRLQTENLANDTTYHIRHISIFLLTDNQFKASGISITNLGNSTPGNVVFAKSTNFPSEAQCWEEVVVDGNYFAKFTPWYKKPIYSGSELIGFELSNVKEDDDYEIYDCFLDENGNTLPYILIGRYFLTSTQQASSVAGTRATMTIGTARSLCQALGTGYQQMDASMQIFWRDLALAVSERVDFNSGAGVESYLGLLNMTQGGWWIDGLTHVDGTYLYCSKPSKYIDQPTANSDGYEALSYSAPTAEGWITKLGYDANHPTINVVSQASGGSASTYYCDYYYYAGGNRPFLVVVGYATAGNGLFRLSGINDWSFAGGVRLCYKPSIQ